MDEKFLQEALSVISSLGQRSHAKETYRSWKDQNKEITPESMASLVSRMGDNPYAQPYMTAAQLLAQEGKQKAQSEEDEKRRKIDSAMAAIKVAQSSGYQIAPDAMPGVIGAIGRGEAPVLSQGDKTVKLPTWGFQPGPETFPVETPVLIPGKSIFEPKPQSAKLSNIRSGEDGWLYGLNSAGEYQQVPGSEGLATKANGYYGIGYKGDELWGINKATGKYEKIQGSEGVKKYDPNKPRTSSSSGGAKPLTRAQKTKATGLNADVTQLEAQIRQRQQLLPSIPKTVKDMTPGSPNYGKDVENPAYRQARTDIENLKWELEKKRSVRDALLQNEVQGTGAQKPAEKPTQATGATGSSRSPAAPSSYAQAYDKDKADLNALYARMKTASEEDRKQLQAEVDRIMFRMPGWYNRMSAEERKVRKNVGGGF